MLSTSKSRRRRDTSQRMDDIKSGNYSPVHWQAVELRVFPGHIRTLSRLGEEHLIQLKSRLELIEYNSFIQRTKAHVHTSAFFKCTVKIENITIPT